MSNFHPYVLSILMSTSISWTTFAQTTGDNLSSESAQQESINIDSLKPKKEKKNLQGVEKIEVTGSHIKRIDIEGPSPVTVIDREDIDKTAYNSVADVLRDSTASSFGAAKEQSGSTAAGVAAVSLRGLGSNRTLVLLNGKRLPVDAAGGVPDLNLIPIAAVERVEILKDGASAIYGSDALGGVVNIITRKDFSGTEVSMQQSTTELGGGDKFDISIVNGFTKGRLNLVTVAQHRNNSEIDSSQRFWNSEGTSTTGSPGSVRQSAPEGSPPGPWQTDNYCPEGQTDVSPYAPNENTPNLRCTYRYGVLATQLPSIQQTSLLSEANVDLKGNTQLKLRVSGTQKSTKWHYAPAPDRIDGIPGNTFQSVSELPGTIDATQPVDLLYRTVELGNRETEITTNAYNILTGLKGEMSETWEWEASANINRVFRNDIGVSGYALYDQIENKVRNKEFNPLASPGARGSLEDTRYQPYQNSMSELAAADFVASGEIGEFLGQPLSLALGAQATSQEYEETVDFQTAAGNVWGNVGSEGGGRRDTQSAFSELSIPVGEKLEMQVAGRFDHYSDFGDTFNPKLGMRYMISPKILLRASAGTGFKAPDMVDLYAGDSNGFPTFIDHTLCAQQKAAGGATPACLPDQHPVQSSGNKGLKEEKSESYNVGAVIQPSRNLNFSVDTWYTKLNNVVGLDADDLLKAERDGIDVSQSGVIINRDGAGEIIFIEAPLQNLSAKELLGVDLGTEFRFGKFSLNVEHSQLFFYKEEGYPGVGLSDKLGQKSKPPWKNTVALGFNPTQNQNGSIIARTIASHKMAVEEAGILKQHTEVDLQYSVNIKSFGTLTAGAKNILGVNPPLDLSQPTDQVDEDIYSELGRSYYVNYKKTF